MAVKLAYIFKATSQEYLALYPRMAYIGMDIKP